MSAISCISTPNLAMVIFGGGITLTRWAPGTSVLCTPLSCKRALWTKASCALNVPRPSVSSSQIDARLANAIHQSQASQLISIQVSHQWQRVLTVSAGARHATAPGEKSAAWKVGGAIEPGRKRPSPRCIPDSEALMDIPEPLGRPTCIWPFHGDFQWASHCFLQPHLQWFVRF